jgi:hypothetical protein
LCSHGCPQQGAAVYNGEGYNEAGCHRDTGLDRAGAPESDERPTDIYAVPYLGGIVGPRTTIIIPPSLRATLADWKLWVLVALHIL